MAQDVFDDSEQVKEQHDDQMLDVQRDAQQEEWLDPEEALRRIEQECLDDMGLVRSFVRTRPILDLVNRGLRR